VQEFTEMNNGKAFFASLDKLGHLYLKILKAGKKDRLLRDESEKVSREELVQMSVSFRPYSLH
jgi:hypothetical protein